MQPVFSPKQVARAIGASESSVKRWCDSGVLPSIKTAGGHRRLPISGILEFVRSKGGGLLEPEVLGLPPNSGSRVISLESTRAEFSDALQKGDFSVCRRLILDLHMAKHSIASICDQVVAYTMHQIGDAWCQGKLEVFEERRGCELCLRIMHELRSTMPLPKSTAPLAMGASASGDPYGLPTRMVELVLVQMGWNSISLGSGIPIESLIRAVEQHRPRLFWLSVSTLTDEAEFIDQHAQLVGACGTQTALVVGGRALHEELRKEINYASYCDSLSHLETFVKAIDPPQKESNPC